MSRFGALTRRINGGTIMHQYHEKLSKSPDLGDAVPDMVYEGCT